MKPGISDSAAAARPAEGGPVVVVGAGGHAKVVVDALAAMGRRVLGLVDPDRRLHGSAVLGCPVLGDDERLHEFAQAEVMLANGVGGNARPETRQAPYEKLKRRGFRFVTVIHPRAIVAPDVVLGEGAQIMAGAIVNSGTRIGENAIVNTGASIDHDCIVGMHCHVAPGAVLCGGVIVGDAVLVGAGATIIPGRHLAARCRVGAGAVVIADVSEGVTVVGNPARSRR